MLNKSGAAPNGAAPSNRRNQAGGLPWLKVENLSGEKRTMTIVMARQQRDRWNNNSVMMQIRYDGKLFLWQPNEKNPNFDLLIDILGPDETKWAGQEVLAFTEQDPISYQIFPRVCGLEDREMPKRGRKRNP